ncbi:MAG: DUF2520 domain-containing protein [Candidatus Marinimicrobia bacterium]|nr:DUF2520 domain-containing protein [Candidatus Neomarinimicrobiota bacterium]MCH7762438.1 DUF2520 domain-containing protein [Candidatus Neomarinimicrobiota bacterium]
MGQVPKNKTKIPYLIIGNGRLATHFGHYFKQLSVMYLHWWRGCEKDLQSQMLQVDKILVLINDDAIENFIQARRIPNKSQVWIHCSGALTTHLADSAHPLMTFSDTFYDMETYRNILFVTESGRASFTELFPELPNPHTSIPSNRKGFYHAWCSMAGNFTTILWQEFFTRLEQEFKISRQMTYPYLNQITKNLQQASSPLTGPLARGEINSLKIHQDNLIDDDFRRIYQAFVDVFLSRQKMGDRV